MLNRLCCMVPIKDFALFVVIICIMLARANLSFSILFGATSIITAGGWFATDVDARQYQHPANLTKY